MRLNNDIVVSSSRLLLVPYDAHHVPTYHGWMADPAIQEATASEPLTLEEEYENQVSWRTSGDKLTFILCLAADGNGNDEDSHGSASKNYGGLSLNDMNSAEAVAIAGQVDAADRMIGDINLFLTPWEEEEEEEDNRDKNDGGVEPTIRNHGQVSYVNGEIDIMIASHAHRRLGLGREAVATLLRYIHVHAHEMLAEYVAFTSTRLPTLSRPLGTSGDSGSDGTSGRQDASSDRQQRQQYMIKDLVAKISEGNQGSIALFKRLGFQQRGEVNYFGEMELVLESFGSEEHDDGGKESFRAAYREVRWDRSRL